MKTILYLICALACFAIVSSCVKLRAQCSGGYCQIPTKAQANYEWRPRADDPGRIYLFRDGVQIGGLDYTTGYYRPYNNDTQEWGECCKSPTNIPEKAFSFGMDKSKLTGQERYTLYTESGCHELSKHVAHQALGQAFEDDSKKLRVTIIGTDSQRKAVMADLAKVPDLDGWAVIRDYPPDHWSVQQGFVTKGSPTIYCQAPSGKVLHRQDDYQGGVESLTGALRKAKSNYDPKKDADLRNGFYLPNIDTAKFAGYAMALVLGIGLIIFLQKKGNFQW